MYQKWKSIEPFFLYFSLAIYIILFLWIIVFTYVSPLEVFSQNRPTIRSISIIPFHQIGRYIFGTANVSTSVVINNIVGNLLLFIPLGLYLQLFKKDKRFFPSFITVFLVSLVIEIVQYILAIGITDIDDIILNTLGGVIGIVIYKLLASWIKDPKKIRTFLTISSSVIALPLLILFILLYAYN